MSLICNKFEPLTIDEVETLLLRHEASLDKFHKKKSLVSVNLTEGVSLSNSPIVQIVQILNSLPNFPNSSNSNLNNRSIDAHLTCENNNNYIITIVEIDFLTLVVVVVLASIVVVLVVVMEVATIVVEEMAMAMVGTPMCNAKI